MLYFTDGRNARHLRQNRDARLTRHARNSEINVAMQRREGSLSNDSGINLPVASVSRCFIDSKSYFRR